MQLQNSTWKWSWLGVLCLLGVVACGGDQDGEENPENPGGSNGALAFSGGEKSLGRSGVIPDLDATSDGNLHLVYRGDRQDGDGGVYYHFYDGSDWSSAVRINDAGHPQALTYEFNNPKVAAAPDGSAVVVWGEQSGSGNRIWSRRINSQGEVQGGFELVHAENGINSEQIDVDIDINGTVHFALALVGSGQVGVYHKSRPLAGSWDSRARTRVFSAGRKHPAIEASPDSNVVYMAWRFSTLGFARFNGNGWEAPQEVPAPAGRSMGNPRIAFRSNGQPMIGTAPHSGGIRDWEAYVVQPGESQQQLPIDGESSSVSGTVEVGRSANGKAIVVWERFVLAAQKEDNSMVIQSGSLDLATQSILNSNRLVYKVSDSSGNFPQIPDEDNSNAFLLPLDSEINGAQTYPAIAIHGNTVDFVYRETQNLTTEWRHRRATFR